MDKTQADAIAQAILEPGVRAQEEIRRKRAAEDLYAAQKRQVAWFVLVGFGIGAAVAYFTDQRITLGGLWGGIAGSVLGWFTLWLRGKSRAT